MIDPKKRVPTESGDGGGSDREVRCGALGPDETD